MTLAIGQLDPTDVNAEDVEAMPARALISKKKAFVAIPRGELVAFAQQQAFTFIAGFTVGVTLGTFFKKR
jgi:hypothetical protein